MAGVFGGDYDTYYCIHDFQHFAPRPFRNCNFSVNWEFQKPTTYVRTVTGNADLAFSCRHPKHRLDNVVAFAQQLLYMYITRYTPK